MFLHRFLIETRAGREPPAFCVQTDVDERRVLRGLNLDVLVSYYFHK